jgi:class 3 adenylate cyclase
VGEDVRVDETEVVVREGKRVRRVPISGRLFVGREVVGVDPMQRLILDDDEVSRHHLEIWLDPEGSRALLIDTSANGTRLNGARVERGAPVPIKNGDVIGVGRTVLEFRSTDYRDSLVARDRRMTSPLVRPAQMALVVGDVVGFTTISELVESERLVGAIGTLFGELRTVLRRHGGSVGNYAGDALFALWELEHFEDAADRALGFVFAASSVVARLAPDLEIRDTEGAPLRMGWGLALGEAATASIGGAALAVLGDTANLAFRLSALAARDGRPEVLGTATFSEALTVPVHRYDQAEVAVKGRTGAEVVYGLRERDSAEGG